MISGLVDSFIRPQWSVPDHVKAVVTSRLGGVSRGPWSSMNLAMHVGDDEDQVRENRRCLSETLCLPSEPLWLSQVHGTTVVDAGVALQGQEADAAYTCKPGRVCAVMTADCLPVLMCDPDGTVVAAAHAGWRGLLDGVLESTISALPGVRGVKAWLGPAIGPAAFEVGAEVREAFCDRQASHASCFRDAEHPGKYMADIYMLATQRLGALGAEVSGGGSCTYSDRERFFSYRRDGVCGRMASLIWLAAQ